MTPHRLRTARRGSGLGALLRDARNRFRDDVTAAKERDPAVRSTAEVVLAYPGLHALWLHRMAHRVWRKPGLWLAARVFLHLNRALSGIEIHPAAQLGKRVFIDHGLGVVIRETAETAKEVLLNHSAMLWVSCVSLGQL